MKTSLLMLSVLTPIACSHVNPDDMSEQEHVRAATEEEQRADQERRQYDPRATAVKSFPIAPLQSNGPEDLAVYNPTAEHLRAAEQHTLMAHRHIAAAQQLATFEDAACAGVSVAARAGCPLVTAAVERVEETPTGIRLKLKPDARGTELVQRMRCHMAYARTLAFGALPSCPLYARGVTIDLVEKRAVIELRAKEPATAAQLREEARELFAPGGVPSAAR